MSKLALPQGWDVEEITVNGVRPHYNVVLSDGIHADAKKVLESQPGMRVVEEFGEKQITGDKLMELLSRTGNDAVHGIVYRSDLDALLKNHGAEILERAEDLMYLIRAGIGVSTPPDHAALAGARILRTPEANRKAVHAYTMSMLKMLGNPFLDMDTNLKVTQKWAKPAWSMEALENPLKGKTLFVVGAGGIGSRVARSSVEEGMNVVFYDPMISEIDGCESVDLEEGLQKADMISVHVDGTKEVLTPEHFKMMKKGVKIVNTARGTVLNSQALYDSLESGQVGRAVLDVHQVEGQELFETQVPAALVNHPRVLATGHVCAREVQAERDNGVDAAQKMVRALLTDVTADAWNVGDMQQLNGIFSNGSPAYVLSLLNRDVAGVHAAVDTVINQVVGSKVNKGADHTTRSFVPLLAGENGKNKVAARLLQLDLVNPPQALLQEVVEIVSQVENVLRARLFRYTKTGHSGRLKVQS